MYRAVFLLALLAPLPAQDPTATLAGTVTDATGAAMAGASVTVTATATGATHSQVTSAEGAFQFPWLAVGEYELRVEAPGFAAYVQTGLRLSLNDVVRAPVKLDLAARTDTLVVTEQAEMVQTSSSVLGSVVTSRQILDLPLNGRNFAQLGLLQTGVAPLTAGVATHGGPRRSGQGYTVNGQRPESNNYLLDGARIVNRIDGGFALRPPMDAIDEFKIMTHNAPAEYGGASGSTTTVITRGGGAQWHGALYEFLRNDRFDCRNFFSERPETLKQNQFGATAGGPLRANALFFFGYYEGFRNRQGITRGATVPTPAQREGDYSSTPLVLTDNSTGQPMPGNRIPASQISPIARRAIQYYPVGNQSPSFYSATHVIRFNSDQGGFRLDSTLSKDDTLALRYATNAVSNVNPMSILGSDIPGFPVGDFISTHTATLSEAHVVSERTVNSLRVSFFRHDYLMERRLSGLSPRDWGFAYDATLEAARGAPALLVSGYSTLGDPVIGPRDTVQNNYEVFDSVSHLAGRHSIKAGGDLRRIQVNAVQGHFANGSFNFTQFPFNDSFANLLTGRPAGFTQAGGDFHRALRGWEMSAFVQDEWKATGRLTLSLGVRYEVSTPFRERRNKLTAFIPGRQSQAFPAAPAGILAAGEEGVSESVAPVYWKGVMPRFGLAWDVRGDGAWLIRSGYGIFYDVLANGVGGPLRVATLSIPWVKTVSLSGGTFPFERPYGGTDPFSEMGFARPASVFTIESGLRPPYAQDWNFSILRNLGSQTLELHYVGTKGTRLPRFVEANPAVYQPGATAADADRRRIYAQCGERSSPCALGHVGLVTGSTSSSYQGAQLSLSRRFSRGWGYQASYTFSKLIDYVSSLHLAGPSPLLIAGESDVAQNPFNLAAERGASLFDARHRLVFSSLFEVPFFRGLRGTARALLDGWQLNTIVSTHSATPFTVYDSRNVSLQAPHPPLSGVFASRPDLVGNPNEGPRRPEEWLSRSAFRRLDPITEAGAFGNAGRNIARGAPFFNWDLSLIKAIPVTETITLQFRAECFNVSNTANLGLPVNDLASPNFGRILEAGRPRLFQIALKLTY